MLKLWITLLAVLIGTLENTHGEILTINLNAAGSDQVWTVSGSNGNTPVSIPATVPGGVYSDLSDAGNIFQSQIYYRYNDVETKWVGYTNWTFSRTFQADEEILSKERIALVCNGLDSVATVYVNDIEVGSSDNMFVKYVFDIKSALKVGSNSLKIQFQSPVEYAKKLWDTSEYPILPECVPDEFQGECHVNYLRKMQASFSWDWGPSYPSSGIWKDIYVEAFNSAVIRDVMLFITPNNAVPDETSDTIWTVTARVYMDAHEIDESGVLTLEAFTSKKKMVSTLPLQLKKQGKDTYSDVTVEVSGSQVRLWWPHGYGNHPLYDFKITYSSTILNEESVKILRGGYRTIELIQDPIDTQNLTKGLTFYFKVNGLRIYAKGTNSIPIHVLPERATVEMTEWLFLSSQEANFNMIRVWGGGIYESDTFYDLADQLGILVWEDFMFACNMYPTNADYLASVTREVESQVKRLQYHPSVAIWATNNENEAAIRDNWYGTDVNYQLYAADYLELYITTILEYVNELDPSRACLPSSPTNGKGSEAEGWIAEDPYSTIYGDIHFYNYKADGWDYRHLLKTRFASEFGFQSWPHPEMFNVVTEAEDRHWFSDMMYHRQHHPGGQEEMRDQIRMHLPLPANVNGSESFDAMLYMAQITQSMSVKSQTEFYRRLKGQMYETGEGENSGALYWQLNDIWPGSSWASIEINGRWKMLHYYVRNFFADVITSAYDLDNGDISIHVTSDLLVPFSGDLRLRLFLLDSMTPLIDRNHAITADPQSASEVLVVGANEYAECHNSVSICLLYMSMEGTPDNFFFLHYPNETSFIETPTLTVRSVSSQHDRLFEIVLETDVITPFVYLNVKDNDVHGWFSDNGFIMVEPTKTISFVSQEPLTLSFFIENLDVISLHDAIV